MLRTLSALLLFILPAFAQAGGWPTRDFLGQYNLVKADLDSELQSVEIKYNTLKELVAVTDFDGMEYELHAPDKNGVLYDEEGEPNCDGGEQACYYDARVTIAISKSGILKVTIVRVDAFDQSGEEEILSYDLKWAKEIPDAIPFYTDEENSPAVAKFETECLEAIKPSLGYGGLSSSSLICGHPSSAQYREPAADALKVYFDAWSNGKAVEISTQDLIKNVFVKAIKVINTKYEKAKLKVPVQTLIDQNALLHSLILKSGDRFFAHDYVGSTIVTAVDSKTKRIVRFDLRTEK